MLLPPCILWVHLTLMCYLLFIMSYSFPFCCLFPQCDCRASARRFILCRLWVLGRRGGVEEVQNVGFTLTLHAKLRATVFLKPPLGHATMIWKINKSTSKWLNKKKVKFDSVEMWWWALRDLCKNLSEFCKEEWDKRPPQFEILIKPQLKRLLPVIVANYFLLNKYRHDEITDMLLVDWDCKLNLHFRSLQYVLHKQNTCVGGGV